MAPTSWRPRPPIQCCTLNYVFGGLQKKTQPFLFMMFGTSKHDMEVGGSGGNVCIYVDSCGGCFLEEPGMIMYPSRGNIAVCDMEHQF